MNIILRNEFV